jgi:hypothetical protein
MRTILTAAAVTPVLPHCLCLITFAGCIPAVPTCIYTQMPAAAALTCSAPKSPPTSALLVCPSAALHRQATPVAAPARLQTLR